MGLDCCIRIIAQWTFRVWGAGIDGESSGGRLRTAGPAVLVTRLSYRILSGRQTARAARIAPAR